jgi:short subunit dehydrogenase-like uncharacterized protein
VSTCLIYGATGYTGRIITRLAIEYGIRPVLAGRDREAVSQLAREYGFDHRVFSLDSPTAIDAALNGISVVLHCAGPFIHTSRPMVDACIRNHVHYADITGEIEVIEAVRSRDAEARAAGVMLLPGSGFDVVPSDCLAAHLKQQLPTATHLKLAIKGSGGLSRGTATTMVEHMERGGMIRRAGELTAVPAGWRTRDVDYGDGAERAISIPWGDIATAFYSTGIPNIVVYAAAPRMQRAAMKLSRFARPLLSTQWAKNVLKRRIRSGRPGPSESQLTHGMSAVWGRVSDASGRIVEARVRGPNGYWLTAHAALLITKRMLSGQVSPGFNTPSLAYGPDLILEVPGTVRESVSNTTG